MNISKAFRTSRSHFFLFFLLPLTLTSSVANAQANKSGQFRMTPQEIMAARPAGSNTPGSSNLSAVQEIVLFGDPSKAGLYTIILKVAANTKIPAHLHPDQRIATVISGTWYFGYGDRFDEGKLKRLPAGSVYSEVAGQDHFAMTKGAVIVEITGFGPSGAVYADPANDPTNKKH